MRYLLMAFSLIFLHNGAKSQGGMRSPYKDKWSVRWSPLGLIDILDGNITVGAAYTVSNRITLGLDLSYIFYSQYIEEKKSVSGYIFKPAFRYYLSDRRRFFAEAAPFYKRVGYRLTDWLGRDYVNGVPSYQQITTFTFRKQVVGLNMMMGVQKSLVRNNLLRLEIYAGISIRYKWQDVKHEPDANYIPNDLFVGTMYEPQTFGAGIPHGLRLVYVVK